MEDVEDEGERSSTRTDDNLDFPPPVSGSVVVAPSHPAVAAAEGGRQGSIIDASLDIVRAHDTEWISNQEACLRPMNGAVAQRQWSIRSSLGDVFGPGCDVGGKQWSSIDYFFMKFPMTHMQEIVRLTNEGLSDKNKVPATVGKLLKFFGVMILCTKFEFKSRSSLWSTTAASKYVPAPSFGATGMSRMRF